MTDLKSPKWMYVKAALFVVIGGMSFALLLLPESFWARVGIQALMIWAFARAYYFAFYVVEHYVDGRYKFAGLIDYFRYVLRRKGT